MHEYKKSLSDKNMLRICISMHLSYLICIHVECVNLSPNRKFSFYCKKIILSIFYAFDHYKSICFQLMDKVQESLVCCHLVIFRWHKHRLIDYNSYAHLSYFRHNRALGQDLSMHAKFFIPVTLTFTFKSTFRLHNLCSGFQK